MHPLHDKVVLITGASSGIGRAAALRLAGYGAKVALTARTLSALEEVASEIGRDNSLVAAANVTDASACQAAIESAVNHFGRLDMLICCAGISMRSQFEHSDLAAMERVMRVNFLGTMYPTYHALPHIRASRGSLVAISSLVGKRGCPTYSIYGASKFAVQGLYESLRLELAPAGVHVGLVSPGHVGTPLRDRVMGPDGEPWQTQPPVPFRVWPVEVCVDRIVRLLVQRKPEELFPAIVRPLLAVDQIVGTWLGDRWLSKRFARAPLPERS